MKLHLTINAVILLLLSSCNPTRFIPEDKALLRKVTVDCDNKLIDNDELEGYIKQKPNRRLLKIIPLHLGIYNLIDPVKEQKRQEKRDARLDQINKKRRSKGKEPKEKFYLTSWLLQIGEEPVIYEDYLTKKTSKQFKQFLRNKGYYSAEVTDSVWIRKNEAYVYYTLHTNKPYRYRNVKLHVEDQKLKSIINSDSTNSLIKPGKLFDVDILQSERERISRLLKRKGYYAFAKEYIDFQVDTALIASKIDITLRVRNPAKTSYGTSNVHKKYWLKNIYIYTKFEPKRAIQEKDAYYQNFDTLFYKGYYFIYENKPAIKPDVIIRAISLSQDSLYNIEDVERSYKYLSSLMVFKLKNILFTESEYHDNTGMNYLDCTIQLTPFVRQSQIVELEGTNTSGNLGVAANYTYQHKSLFRGAELFEIKFKGAMQVQTKASEAIVDDGQVTEYLPFNTLEVGPESTLRFPKLLLPLRLSEFTRTFHPKTALTSAYNYQSRPQYTRTILTSKINYFWTGRKNITQYVSPLEIDFIKLIEIDSVFNASLSDSYFKNSYQDQLITSAHYNIVYTNQNLRKNKDFSYLKTGLETAGNMLSLYNSAVKGGGTSDPYSVLGVDYAQYIKFDFDFSYHKILNENNKIVYRNIFGIGVPYGNSEAIPFVKQYFSGGANSVRAWPVRSLGPGTYQESEEQLYPNQTSDLRLELNLEYRFHIIAMLEGALFVDAGNIWSLSKNDDREGAIFEFNDFYKELAVGAGIGVRLDFDFFIFRLDYGYKMMDPIEPEGQRFIPFNRPFGQENYAFNVAIGYPF